MKKIIVVLISLILLCSFVYSQEDFVIASKEVIIDGVTYIEYGDGTIKPKETFTSRFLAIFPFDFSEIRKVIDTLAIYTTPSLGNSWAQNKIATEDCRYRDTGQGFYYLCCGTDKEDTRCGGDGSGSSGTPIDVPDTECTFPYSSTAECVSCGFDEKRCVVVSGEHRVQRLSESNGVCGYTTLEHCADSCSDGECVDVPTADEEMPVWAYCSDDKCHQCLSTVSSFPSCVKRGYYSIFPAGSPNPCDVWNLDIVGSDAYSTRSECEDAHNVGKDPTPDNPQDYKTQKVCEDAGGRCSDANCFWLGKEWNPSSTYSCDDAPYTKTCCFKMGVDPTKPIEESDVSLIDDENYIVDDTGEITDENGNLIGQVKSSETVSAGTYKGSELTNKVETKSEPANCFKALTWDKLEEVTDATVRDSWCYRDSDCCKEEGYDVHCDGSEDAKARVKEADIIGAWEKDGICIKEKVKEPDGDGAKFTLGGADPCVWGANIYKKNPCVGGWGVIVAIIFIILLARRK